MAGDLLRIGGLMLLAAAGSMALDVAAGFVSARTGAKIGPDSRRACLRGWWPSPMPRSTSSRRPRSSRAAPTMSPSSRTCAPWRCAWCSTPPSSPSAAWSWSWSPPTPSWDWIVVLAVAVVFAVIAVLFRFTLPRFKIMQTLIDRVNLVAREMSERPVGGARLQPRGLRGEPLRRRLAQAARHPAVHQPRRGQLAPRPPLMLVMNLTSVAIVWFGADGRGRGHPRRPAISSRSSPTPWSSSWAASSWGWCPSCCPAPTRPPSA